MASRWFVFWIAMFVVSTVQEKSSWWVYLLLAFMTGDPIDGLKDAIYQDTKRIVKQYFSHYFKDNE